MSVASVARSGDNIVETETSFADFRTTRPAVVWPGGTARLHPSSSGRPVSPPAETKPTWHNIVQPPSTDGDGANKHSGVIR
jgi:hypothetical protein